MDKPKRKKTNRNNFVKAKLRFASIRWPPKSEALKASRKERGQYECSMCKGLFKANQVQADHIYPVVPLNNDWPYGFIDWNIYIERLFCEAEGYQILCERCHESKTMQEDLMRVSIRDIKKNKSKEKVKKKDLDKSKK